MNQDLFEAITSWNALIWGYHRAARKCKRSLDRASFIRYLSHELYEIRSALVSGKYQWGPYEEKVVVDPKRRTIHKAPFRDRIVHQALILHVNKILDPKMIFQTFACRKNKGTGEGIEILRRKIRQFDYAIKLDVSKFFQSINCDRMKEKLSKVITEPRTNELICSLIDSHKEGLPIGNLSSQIFANWYLNDLDHYAKRVLKLKNYFRYMDDVIVLGNSKEELWGAASDIKKFAEKEKLTFPERKTQLFSTESGVPFLGLRFFKKSRTRVLQRSYIRFKKRMKVLKKSQKLPNKRIEQSVFGWYGHTRHGLTKKTIHDLDLHKYLGSLH